MSESFSISRPARDGWSRDALQEEVRLRTGNDSATESIMRSIDRFGSDDSIRYYELTPKANYRRRSDAVAQAWTVRAVR